MLKKYSHSNIFYLLCYIKCTYYHGKKHKASIMGPLVTLIIKKKLQDDLK